MTYKLNIFKENYPSLVVLPVFHNVQPIQTTELMVCLQKLNVSIASISLRHSTAMKSLESLLQPKNDFHCRIGASTLTSSHQAAQVTSYGVDFISSMNYSQELVQSSIQMNLPLLCGVNNIEQCYNAIDSKVSALKLYPSSCFTPNQAIQIFDEVRMRSSIPFYLAGGISLENIDKYYSVGLTHFAIGFDLNKLSLTEVEYNLNRYEELLTKSRANRKWLYT
eukprot:gene15780-21371_t